MKNTISRLIGKLKTIAGIIALFKNWLIFMLCYLNLIRKNDLVLKFRNGLKWHVDCTKRGFAVLGDVWLQKPYRLLFSIKNPKTIIDLGAHIGSFSIMAAKRYPKAAIYAIEASKENFSMLEKNLAENKIKNVKAINIGAGSKDAALDFFISEKNTVLNSFMKSRKKSSSNSYKVNVKRLSTIFSELGVKKCDFLKIDIEGMEFPVLLAAAKDRIISRIHALSAEISPDSKAFKKTAELLSLHGFSVTKNKDIINAVRLA